MGFTAAVTATGSVPSVAAATGDGGARLPSTSFVIEVRGDNTDVVVSFEASVAGAGATAGADTFARTGTVVAAAVAVRGVPCVFDVVSRSAAICRISAATAAWPAAWSGAGAVLVAAAVCGCGAICELVEVVPAVLGIGRTRRWGCAVEVASAGVVVCAAAEAASTLQSAAPSIVLRSIVIIRGLTGISPSSSCCRLPSAPRRVDVQSPQPGQAEAPHGPAHGAQASVRPALLRLTSRDRFRCGE